MATPTNHNSKHTHLPILDLSGDDETQIAQDLLAAAAEWGFVYVRARGLEVDAAHLDRIFNLVCTPLRCA